MIDHYILNDRDEPVLEPDLKAWKRWFQVTDRCLEQTVLGLKKRMIDGEVSTAEVYVSTAFMGFDRSGSSLLYETRVFGSLLDQEHDHYCTREEALVGHHAMVARVEAVMGKINYVNGDATDPQGYGKKIIAHVCNDQGGWGAGFVLALNKKWREPKKDYQDWIAYRHNDGNNPHLGNIRLVQVSDVNISVCNMIAQKGFGGVAIQYDKLRECLVKLRDVALRMDAKVHAPKFGAGLAGGDWNTIEKIIEEELCLHGVDVTVYLF